MTTSKKNYIKVITQFFVKIPENIQFFKTEYTGKVPILDFNLLESASFSIGDKDTNDCTR